MANIEMYEGSGFNIYFTLKYGANFDGGTEGQPIPRSTLSRVYLYVKRKSDSTVLFTLSDRTDALVDQPSQIQWTNENGGLCTAKILSSHTTGKQELDCIFELWGTLVSNAQSVLLDRGTVDILDSIKA